MMNAITFLHLSQETPFTFDPVKGQVRIYWINGMNPTSNLLQRPPIKTICLNVNKLAMSK